MVFSCLAGRSYHLCTKIALWIYTILFINCCIVYERGLILQNLRDRWYNINCRLFGQSLCLNISYQLFLRLRHYISLLMFDLIIWRFLRFICLLFYNLQFKFRFHIFGRVFLTIRSSHSLFFLSLSIGFVKWLQILEAPFVRLIFGYNKQQHFNSIFLIITQGYNLLANFYTEGPFDVKVTILSTVKDFFQVRWLFDYSLSRGGFNNELGKGSEDSTLLDRLRSLIIIA